MVAGILLAIVAVVAVLFLFGNFTDGDIDPSPTAGIEAPDVSNPDVNVDVPNPDVDVNVTSPSTDAPSAPQAPAATDAPSAQPAPTE
jgi:hypothetical protein